MRLFIVVGQKQSSQQGPSPTRLVVVVSGKSGAQSLRAASSFEHQTGAIDGCKLNPAPHRGRQFADQEGRPAMDGHASSIGGGGIAAPDRRLVSFEPQGGDSVCSCGAAADGDGDGDGPPRRPPTTVAVVSISTGGRLPAGRLAIMICVLTLLTTIIGHFGVLGRLFRHIRVWFVSWLLVAPLYDGLAPVIIIMMVLRNQMSANVRVVAH
jgi:hypothetical protein